MQMKWMVMSGSDSSSIAGGYDSVLTLAVVASGGGAARLSVVGRSDLLEEITTW